MSPQGLKARDVLEGFLIFLVGGGYKHAFALQLHSSILIIFLMSPSCAPSFCHTSAWEASSSVTKAKRVDSEELMRVKDQVHWGGR